MSTPNLPPGLDGHQATAVKLRSIVDDLGALGSELARLRAEVEQMMAPVGLDYTRVDDGEDPQPLAGRVPPSFGAVADSSMRLIPLAA